MKAIVLQEPRNLTVADVEPPAGPGAGEALVRVHQVGVCGTDLHAYAGRQPFFEYPRIMGHELGVEIMEIAPGPHGLQAGDRCAVEPYLSCGRCVACRRGKPNCCVSVQTMGVHIDGGMQELYCVPIDTLHKSDVLSYDQLPLVETLSIGAHAVARADLEPDENVLVIGAGPIGLATIVAAQLRGANVMVLDLSPVRSEFCRRQLGVKTIIDPTENPIEQVQALTRGEMPTAVFDATGNASSMMHALHFVAPGGKLVYVGFSRDTLSFENTELHRREITLLGSRNALASDFAGVMRDMEAGRIDVSAWITHRASLSEVAGEFPRWLDPSSGIIKAVISID